MFQYQRLTSDDVTGLQQLNYLFGIVFEEPHTYHDDAPADDYLQEFLDNDKHIVLVARDAEQNIVGGVVAYIFHKFEKKRSEIYLYEIAVLPAYQRQGIARNLFENLKTIAKQYDADYPTCEIFLQTDNDNYGAIEFYRTTINSGEQDAVHFYLTMNKDDA